MTASSDKKALLLEGAATAFLKGGFEATTMQDIADVCGVGKGTLYGYFSSKEDLFIEVCLHDFAEDPEGIDRVFMNSESPENALRVVLDDLLAKVPWILERMPLYLTFWARLSFDARFREHCHQGFRQLYRLLREALARGLARAQGRGTVRPDMDPRDIATAILCTLDGYIYQRLFAEPDLDLKRLEQTIRVVLLDGLAVGERSTQE